MERGGLLKRDDAVQGTHVQGDALRMSPNLSFPFRRGHTLSDIVVLKAR